ncbi:MAG: ThuA domain-containing protein [Chloroflexota bacterium]
MRILVLCGDFHHRAEVAQRGLEAIDSTEFTFDWLTEADSWSAEKMNEYSLTILTRANHRSQTDQTPWMTPEIEAAFLDYVRRGNGLFVIHSGTALYDKCEVLRPLMGGVFTMHPPQCPVTVEPQENHPLAAGSTPFTLVDEHYFLEVDDPAADIFLSASSEHGTQPAGWTRTEGDGRVCVLIPSHNVEIWLHPSFQVLLQNGLNWCAKKT